MPTVYTEIIANGGSFEEFVYKCAGSFSFPLNPREEESDPFVMSDHYLKTAVLWEEQILRIKNTSLKELQKEVDQVNQEKMEDYIRMAEEQNALRERYEDMLDHVRSWRLISTTGFVLKEFMIRQIKEGIEADCNVPVPPPPRYTVKRYVAEKTAEYTTQAQNLRSKHEEEKKWIEDKLKFTNELRESLKKHAELYGK